MLCFSTNHLTNTQQFIYQKFLLRRALKFRFRQLPKNDNTNTNGEKDHHQQQQQHKQIINRVMVKTEQKEQQIKHDKTTADEIKVHTRC